MAQRPANQITENDGFTIQHETGVRPAICDSHCFRRSGSGAQHITELFKPFCKENAEAPPNDRPTFTDPNLVITGGIGIKALHITELRAAINNLRVRLGMSAYTWTKPTATGGVVASGGPITAGPIIEMRTALDQALGAPSPAYAARASSRPTDSCCAYSRA
ncbi:MAG: hypothetical protein ACXW3C_00250, partial [Pyrinomonadaceae bacterium]